MITAAAPFIAPPRISRERFAGVLRDAGSPWAGRAHELYDLIVARQHDPAVWLAICAVEHTYGTNRDSVLWRHDTRSWTNARSVRDPSLTGWSLVFDPQRRSSYVRYADVADSLRDGCYRITDATYRYVIEGRFTIAQVLAIWTEGDAPRYTARVVALLNTWISAEREETPPMSSQQPGYAWHPSPSFGYPRGHTSRLGRLRDKIIIHTTEGSYASSLSWLTRQPTPDDEGSSAHYLIGTDPSQRAQLVLEEHAAWTAGNKEYNLSGINIELVGWAAKNPPVTPWQIKECARLCAALIRRTETLVHVIGHDDVPDQDHTDPGQHFPWDRLRTLIAEYLRGEPPTTDPHALARDIAERLTHPDGREFHVPRVFWDYIIEQTRGDQTQVIRQFGHPISGAYIDPDSGLLVMWFERARLELHPEAHGTRWFIQTGRVGAELLATRA